MTLMLGSLKAAVDLADPASVDSEAVREELLNLTDPDGEKAYARRKDSSEPSRSSATTSP